MEIRTNSNDELERFKLEINLVEYAASEGFLLYKKHSSKNSKAMKHPSTREKIIVATSKATGHCIYFDVHEDEESTRNGGTIIDFVKNRHGLNIGQVRKVLRAWMGGDREPMVDSDYQKPLPSDADIQKVIESYGRANSAIPYYLIDKRGIDRETIEDDRFTCVIRVDVRGNALFPHFDANGLCGYEIKNHGYTGFASGGRKGLWKTRNINAAQRIIICESAIDALSYAQLHDDPGAAYVSLGGGLNDQQPDLVRELMRQAAKRGAQVIIAVDRDNTGHKYTRDLGAWAREIGIKAIDDRPVGGFKDWNEALQELQKQEDKTWAWRV